MKMLRTLFIVQLLCALLLIAVVLSALIMTEKQSVKQSYDSQKSAINHLLKNFVGDDYKNLVQQIRSSVNPQMLHWTTSGDILIMTLLGFLPAMLMMMTCFTRFIIVLAILRQAIGLQQSPPNPVLVGIALCLTLLVMRPVWQEIHQEAYLPFEGDTISLEQGLERGKNILSRFMLAQTSKTALAQVTSGNWSNVAGFWSVWVDLQHRKSAQQGTAQTAS